MTVYRGKDAKIIIDGVTVALAQSASVEVSTGLESLYEIGNPNPVVQELGEVEITGSLERIIGDASLFGKAIPKSQGGKMVLTTFSVVFKASDASGAPMVSLTNCMAESGSIEIPVDDWLTESIDFRATSITLLTVP